jgi:plasmid maintenance system killer protein
MNIQFRDKDLSDAKKRKGKFSHTYQRIEDRLYKLSLAKNLDEYAKTYPGARCHEYNEGSKEGIFTIDLSGNWRLRFRPIEFELKDDGGIDLKSVTSIIILGISNH